jgi:hypothetical protein
MLDNTEDGSMNTFKTPASEIPDRRPWEPPTVKAVGTVGEVLKQGGGKITKTGGDPGEARKQTPAQ